MSSSRWFFSKTTDVKKDERCKEKRTILCKFETYQFEIMPFGLKNSGATFQRSMYNILVNVSNVKCYIDDEATHSKAEKSNINHLENVVVLLLKHRLRIRLKKCSFMQLHVELLGNCMHKEGIHTYERTV